MKRPSDTKRVKVYKDGDRFLAMINNGWWMAYGKTAKEAAKRVVKRYQREAEKFLLIMLSCLLTVGWLYEDGDSIATVSLGEVAITSYQAVEEQTDASPHIAADGTDLRETDESICAVSQDFLWRNGGAVRWRDALWLYIPRYPGDPVVQCIVRDTMAETIFRNGVEVPLVRHVDLLDGVYGRWIGRALLVRGAND